MTQEEITKPYKAGALCDSSLKQPSTSLIEKLPANCIRTELLAHGASKYNTSTT